MKNLALLFILLGFVTVSFKAGTGFRAEQKRIARVKAAYTEKWAGVKKRLAELGVDTASVNVCIRGFKQEGKLELWVKSAKSAAYQLYTTYDICSASGVLGPKRCQGDLQVPEGFYHVNIFNPYSAYHLSLGVSYPNAADRVFACKRDPGGAIMIHGNCVTIGCIPITDDKIKEVYVLCVEAKNAGQQNIPIHIFPARLSEENLKALLAEKDYAAHAAFWTNLKKGYDHFEEKKMPAKVSVDVKGNYVFN